MPDPKSSEELREKVASKLLEAIDVAETLAKKSGKTAEKGAGGMPPKARWYQLMAYLSQTLNGVLHNMDMNQVKHDLAELEKQVVKLRDQNQKAQG